MEPGHFSHPSVHKLYERHGKDSLYDRMSVILWSTSKGFRSESQSTLPLIKYSAEFTICAALISPLTILSKFSLSPLFLFLCHVNGLMNVFCLFWLRNTQGLVSSQMKNGKKTWLPGQRERCVVSFLYLLATSYRTEQPPHSMNEEETLCHVWFYTAWVGFHERALHISVEIIHVFCY